MSGVTRPSAWRRLNLCLETFSKSRQVCRQLPAGLAETRSGSAILKKPPARPPPVR